MTSLREIFEQEGTRRDVAGNQPLALDDPDSVWLVSSGRMWMCLRPWRSMKIRPHPLEFTWRELTRVTLLIGGKGDAGNSFGLVALGTCGK